MRLEGCEMKSLLVALILVAATCIAALLLAQAAQALFTGESFPVPVPKRVTITVPFSVP